MKLTLLLGLILIPAPLLGQSHQATASPASGETGAIYAAAIHALFPQDQSGEKPIKVFVVEDRTRFDKYDGPAITSNQIDEALPILPNDLLADFLAKNAVRRKVDAFTGLPHPVKLFDSARVGTGVPDFAFQTQFPGNCGLLSVSSIGFNRPANRALVYVANVYGADGGKGYVIVLKRNRHGRWSVARMAMIWTWVG